MVLQLAQLNMTVDNTYSVLFCSDPTIPPHKKFLRQWSKHSMLLHSNLVILVLIFSQGIGFFMLYQTLCH